MMAYRAWEVHGVVPALPIESGDQYPVCSMHVVSRLSLGRNGGGAARPDLAHRLFAEQGATGRLRSGRQTWRVWQEAASHVPGYYEICPGPGSRVDRPACWLVEFQSVQSPVYEVLRVALVSGSDEHHLRSAFHDFAGLELRASFTSSQRSAFLYPIQVHAKPVARVRRSRLFLYQLHRS